MAGDDLPGMGPPLGSSDAAGGEPGIPPQPAGCWPRGARGLRPARLCPLK